MAGCWNLQPTHARNIYAAAAGPLTRYTASCSGCRCFSQLWAIVWQQGCKQLLIVGVRYSSHEAVSARATAPAPTTTHSSSRACIAGTAVPLRGGADLVGGPGPCCLPDPGAVHSICQVSSCMNNHVAVQPAQRRVQVQLFCAIGLQVCRAVRYAGPGSKVVMQQQPASLATPGGTTGCSSGVANSNRI
jgi:hypothetical protein